MNKEVILAAAIVVALGSSMATARDGGAHHFNELDADSNGEVTQDEMKAHADARFAAADTDGDGFLDQAELVARAAVHAKERAGRMLEQLDANGDKVLSADELEKMGDGHGEKRASRMFERMDADKDGKLAQAEMMGRHDPAKMFTQLDSDSNGTLSEEEFEKAGRHGGKKGRHGHKDGGHKD